ncbi:Asparagine synthetase [glutamine-hydrolyzing] (EC [Olavius sp. associated proteobacterium Delta 1]|nr:Asparagine synthetase [glutamine-hydrolyzing] (EC [Olavius sp. associated proteobacterium Delta 1]
MCGICGIVCYDESIRVNQELVERMMLGIKHRGPDDCGLYVKKIVGLGHTRLSIIDLKGGRQPIFNEDQSMCIVFNGEIYNYLELRNDLVQKGHIFGTRSDTEVILHLYEDKGERCVEYLRGMFAFAIWDSKARSLFLARDRLGIKPLYYDLRPKSLAFSSELKSLLEIGMSSRELNLVAADHYFTLNYTIGPQTAIQGIEKLMPGHTLLMREPGIRLNEYWDFAEVAELGDPFDACYSKMKELIEEAVRIRLMSEVPLGAFLSGGVDSSVIVGIMTMLTGKPVKTFTVGYENAEADSELKYAKKVAKHFDCEHHEFILKPKNFMDIIKKVVWHLDEPIAEYAAVPLLLLSELAKQHVTVMLSGEGADEIFAGYPIYRYMNQIELYRRAPERLRKAFEKCIAGPLLRNKREGKYLDWLSTSLEERYLGNGSYLTARMKNRLYSEDFFASVNTSEPYDAIGKYYRKIPNRDAIGKMLYLDTKTWLPEDLLIKADKMTMAAAIELRVPFLDHKLVEYAASLPAGMKVRNFESKYIFKRYAEELLPRDIVYRPKKGFPVPVKKWLRQELNTTAQELLLDKRTRERGLLNSKYIESMLNQHIAGKEDFSKNIWNLLVFEIWMRTFIDGDL